MKKLFLVSIFSFIFCSCLFAQQSVFQIILNKGDNTYGSGSQFSLVLLGGSLSGNDIIKVTEGGYVALLHDSSGSSIELNKKGNYTVQELEQKIKDQSHSILAKYGKFLMDRLNPENEGNQNLNITGAVERGDAGLINVYLPKIADVFGNELIISWQPTDVVKDYIVRIKDKLDETITEIHVNGTKYKLKLDHSPVKDEKMMIINVRAKDNNSLFSKDYGIKRLSDYQSQPIREEFAKLKKMADSDNTLNKLIIASFFEKNKLLADAIIYYDQALAITPDPDGFNKLYDNFLFRNGLK